MSKTEQAADTAEQLKTYRIAYGFCGDAGAILVHAKSARDARQVLREISPGDYYEIREVDEVKDASQTLKDREQYRRIPV